TAGREFESHRWLQIRKHLRKGQIRPPKPRVILNPEKEDRMTRKAEFRTLGRGLELSNLIEAYLLACQAEGKSPQTIRWYEQKLRAFTDNLRSRRLPLRASAVTPEIMRGFIAHLQETGVSPITDRCYALVTQRLYTWL